MSNPAAAHPPLLLLESRCDHADEYMTKTLAPHILVNSIADRALPTRNYDWMVIRNLATCISAGAAVQFAPSSSAQEKLFGSYFGNEP